MMLVGRAAAGVRRFAATAARRIRERGRTAAMRAARLTGAAVTAFVAAQAVGLRHPPPLIAALTALLVVQATLASTLTNGIQRVLSVVAGVSLAVLFVSVVGLTWWSLAALVGASIVVGQLLRLGPHLVEVPISAMLVLGVGYSAGAESVGAGRVVETLIGAAVGVLVNVLFPPQVQSRYAGEAVQRLAEEIAALLERAAGRITIGDLSAEDTRSWLEDARRFNRHVPRVDRALSHAEESRRLNVRALAVPRSSRSLRGGLEALELCSVAVRSFFRSVDDWVAGGTPEQDEQYAPRARRAWSELLGELGSAVRCFGTLLRAEVDRAAAEEAAELTATLERLHRARERWQDVLLADPREHLTLWELNGALVALVDRMLVEFDATRHAVLREERRRQAIALRRAAEAVERLRRTGRQSVSRRRPDQNDDAPRNEV